MVKHNHNWIDIKGYALSELGVFVREAAAEEHVAFKSSLLANWLGTNADQKYLQSLMADNVADVKAPEMSAQEFKQVEHEWHRAASALSKLR